MKTTLNNNQIDLNEIKTKIDSLVENEYEENGFIIPLDFETSPAMFSDVFFHIGKFIEEKQITAASFDLEDDDELDDTILELIEFNKIVENYRRETEEKVFGNNEHTNYDEDISNFSFEDDEDAVDLSDYGRQYDEECEM